MLEIIAIIFLGRLIKKIVNEKDLNATKYILLMVFFWMSFEFLGLMLGTIILGEGLESYFIALIGAALGGYLGYYIAKNA